ncbi:MAG: hypothetical protein Q4C12_03505 [Clostridia bacterium]|nr:hypothetical protein [Clostridia bacterium]
MGKVCYCCGKPVKFMDMDLQNGKICDECYETATKLDRKITCLNIFKYNGAYIKRLLDSQNIDKPVLAECEHSASENEINSQNLQSVKTKKTFEEESEKANSVLSSVIKLCVCLLVLIILFGLSYQEKNIAKNLKNQKQDEQTTYISNANEDTNISPEAAINSLKNAIPPNASGTIDELFRQNYGTPKYYTDTDGTNKYVILAAASHTCCETLILKYKVVSSKRFDLVEGTIRSEIDGSDHIYSPEAMGVVLKLIYKN